MEFEKKKQWNYPARYKRYTPVLLFLKSKCYWLLATLPDQVQCPSEAKWGSVGTAAFAQKSDQVTKCETSTLRRHDSRANNPIRGLNSKLSVLSPPILSRILLNARHNPNTPWPTTRRAASDCISDPSPDGAKALLSYHPDHLDHQASYEST